MFANPVDYRFFLRAIASTSKAMQVRLVAFVMLPESYQLVVQTRLPNLAAVIRQINGQYARRKRKLGEKDKVFVGRYKAALIEPKEYLAQVVRHVHRAPMEEGSATGLDYVWSSYRSYLFQRNRPAWLDVECILDLFPGDLPERRQACKRFMSQDETLQFKSLYARGRLPTILGSDAFIAEHRGKGRDGLQKEAPPSSKRLEYCVRDAVCQVFGVAAAELMDVKKGKSNPARGAYIYLLRRAAGFSVMQIAAVIGAGGHSSVSSAVQRFALKLRKEPDLRKKVEKLQNSLRKDFKIEATGGE